MYPTLEATPLRTGADVAAAGIRLGEGEGGGQSSVKEMGEVLPPRTQPILSFLGGSQMSWARRWRMLLPNNGYTASVTICLEPIEHPWGLSSWRWESKSTSFLPRLSSLCVC